MFRLCLIPLLLATATGFLSNAPFSKRTSQLGACTDDEAAVNAGRLAAREERELGLTVGPASLMTKVPLGTSQSKAAAAGRLMELERCL